MFFSPSTGSLRKESFASHHPTAQSSARSHTMKYEIIKTKYGNESLYVPAEQMLYVSTGRKKDYICYQTVLRSQKNKDCQKHRACTCRIRRLANGLCYRLNVLHSPHPDHKIIVSDKKIMESVLQKCATLKVHHAEDAYRVPNRHIFQREIAKYEYCISTLSNMWLRMLQRY